MKQIMNALGACCIAIAIGMQYNWDPAWMALLAVGIQILKEEWE